MFDAIRKFTRRHKEARKQSLLENAKRIMEHDHHLLAGQIGSRRPSDKRPV